MVTELVEEDRIHTIDVEDLNELGEFVMRVYDRDRDRLSEGRQRAKRLKENDGTLEICRTFEGLGDDSLEMNDLLSYLCDTVRFFASASKRLEPKPNQLRGKLVPPYVIPPHRWHVTKQGDWLQTKVLATMD